jgi:hypothetical protein
MSTALTNRRSRRWDSARKIARSACAGGLVLATFLATRAQAAVFQVVGTGGTLHIRTAPTLGAPIIGSLPDGTAVNIVCQTRGDQVGGSTMWDAIDQPTNGYIADWYTTTPNVNAPSPGLPSCPQPPQPQPPQQPPARRGNISQIRRYSWGLRVWLNHTQTQAVAKSEAATSGLRKAGAIPFIPFPANLAFQYIGCAGRYAYELRHDDVGYGVVFDAPWYTPIWTCGLKVWSQ